ncbi:MAG: hypothetical protein QM796_01130 [Chthoniobacteraceae bacterium]
MNRWMPLLGLCLSVALVGASTVNGASPSATERFPASSIISCFVISGDAVFASTDDGLFQGSLQRQTWEKMKTPPGLLPKGKLLLIGRGNPRLYYYLSDLAVLYSKQSITPNTGSLYVSEDLGKTWQEKFHGVFFRNLYVHPNGSLYGRLEELRIPRWPYWAPGDREESMKALGSLVFSPDWPDASFRDRKLVLSHDDGKTWEDIANGIPDDYDLGKFFPDPDHPDQACFVGAYSRHLAEPMVFQAKNESYAWEKTPENQWHGGVKTRDCFGGFRGGSNIDTFVDLSDFYRLRSYVYGGNSVQAVQIDVEKPTYSFQMGRKMPVKVEVKVVLEGVKWWLLDHLGSAKFWSLQIASPEGKQFWTEGGMHDLSIPPEERNAKIAQLWKDPALKTITIDDAHSYSTTLDLSRIYAFPKPGKYRLMISHDDAALTNQGGIAGPVIEVTIQK